MNKSERDDDMTWPSLVQNNTAQIEVTFTGLREVKLNGFSSNMTADIFIEENMGVQIRISAPGSDMRAVAHAAVISKVSAYLNTPG